MRHVDQLREKFPHVGAERERGSGVLMPFVAQALEEFLPGGSGGTGSEGRANAGRVEIVPGAAKFSTKEELSVRRRRQRGSCHAITGGGSVHPNPGPSGFFCTAA
jgi:hypothetical protein